ncbi:MAG TPA: hypothetical protein VF585_06145 [Chthoniobacterales bacterium]
MAFLRWALQIGLLSQVFWLPGTAWADGTFHDRLAKTNEELALRPDDSALLLRVAQLYLEHEEWTKALEVTEKVEKSSPGEIGTKLVRGQAWLMAAQPEKAREELDLYLQERPEDPKVLILRGRCFDLLEQGDRSIADFRKALELTKEPGPDLYHEAAALLEKYGFRKEAIATLDVGISKLGPLPSLALLALQAEEKAGDIDAALTRIDAMQKAAPRPEPWMAKRAALLGRAHQQEASKAAWLELKSHLEALPSQEHSSNSMSQLLEETLTAIAAADPAAVK